jgi:penicillin-binding protein 1A
MGIGKKLSKDQILELYLNRIYLGSGAYGVDGAAQVYFGKSARDVTLAEAAMLAALTRAPSTFTPRRDLAAAQLRSKIVLDIMLETGTASAEEVAVALAKPAEIVDHSELLERAYYFDAAAEEVKKLLPNARGDLIVETTFDLRMQEAAHKTLNEVLETSGSAMQTSQAALVSMSPDGAVHAIIGGRDYADSSFNRATQARRQPGSSFKPFVYLTALERGLHPWDVRSGGPVNIRGYRPQNYGGRNWGYMTLEDALRHSVNTVAVRVAREVGIPRIAETAKRLGITTPLHTYPSLPLGTTEVSPYEMTGAFAAFASGGLKATPYTVLKILNPKGEILYERGTAQAERIIDE